MIGRQLTYTSPLFLSFLFLICGLVITKGDENACLITESVHFLYHFDCDSIKNSNIPNLWISENALYNLKLEIKLEVSNRNLISKLPPAQR